MISWNKEIDIGERRPKMCFDGERDVRMCSKCNNLIWDTNAEKCPHCGKKLPAKKVRKVFAKKCPNCGKLYDVNKHPQSGKLVTFDKTCVACGYGLEGVKLQRVSISDPGWNVGYRFECDVEKPV